MEINPKLWTKVKNASGIPDILMPLFNYVGMQLRYHTVNGMDETITINRIIGNALEFFRDNPKALPGVYNVALYSEEDILIAAKIGEVSQHDANHIVSLLPEAREIIKFRETTGNKEENPNWFSDTILAVLENWQKQEPDTWHGYPRLMFDVSNRTGQDVPILAYVSELLRLVIATRLRIAACFNPATGLCDGEGFFIVPK